MQSAFAMQIGHRKSAMIYSLFEVQAPAAINKVLKHVPAITLRNINSAVTSALEDRWKELQHVVRLLANLSSSLQ